MKPTGLLLPVLFLFAPLLLAACTGQHTSTATTTPTSISVSIPTPVVELSFRGIAIIGDTVVVKAAISGPVSSEPMATLDGRSPDAVKVDRTTLEHTFIFLDVAPGEHDVHVSGGNLSRTERITAEPAKERPCTVLPLPTPTAGAPGAPTATPPSVLEIEIRRVEAFDSSVRVAYWFGPGGFGSVLLDGRAPDLSFPNMAAGEFTFLFLGVSPGTHTVLAQGYPHRLETRFTCDLSPSQAPSTMVTPTISAPPPIVRYRVYGIVYDSRQGTAAAIAGAVVVGFFGGERSRLNSLTDASGRYEFDAFGHAVVRSAEQPVYLEVTAEGYGRATLTCLTVGPQAPSYAALYAEQCDVGLEPKP